MSEVRKRIFDVLDRVVRFVTAYRQLFGKANDKKTPRVTVIQTRKTLTQTTKRTKGDRL